MAARLAEGEKKLLAQISPIVDPDKRFICIGPHCWGRGISAEQAVKNAKRERVKIYEPKRGWCWALYRVHKSVEVEGVSGGFQWDADIPEVEARQLIALYNMPPANGKDPEGVVRGGGR